MIIQFKSRYTRNKVYLGSEWGVPFKVTDKNKRNVRFAIENGMEFKIIKEKEND